MVDLSDTLLDPKYRIELRKVVPFEVRKKLSCSDDRYHLGMIAGEYAHVRVLNMICSWYKLTDRIQGKTGSV